MVKKTGRDGALSCDYIYVMDLIGDVRPCVGSHFQSPRTTPPQGVVFLCPSRLLFIEGAAHVDAKHWTKKPGHSIHVVLLMSLHTRHFHMKDVKYMGSKFLWIFLALTCFSQP